MDNDSFFDDDLPPDLHQLARRYTAQPTPRPNSEATARLVARLLAEDPALREVPRTGTAHLLSIVPVVRWRLHLLGPWFWVASVCLFGLAAVLTPHFGSPTGLSPFILMAPLTMILGLGHALRTRSGGLRAVEWSCPISFIETSAALIGAIAVFDSIIGVMGSIGLALLHWASFGALVVAWLCPLLVLTGISLPIALRWGALPALFVGGGPWLLLAVVAVFDPAGIVSQVFALPQSPLSLLIHLAAALFGLSTVLLVLLHGSDTRAAFHER